jgi:hypothetical protein
VLKFALPWLVSHAADTRAILGDNFWRYGFKETRDEVAAMTRYAHEDGLAARMVDPAELFHPSVLDAADVANAPRGAPRWTADGSLRYDEDAPDRLKSGANLAWISFAAPIRRRVRPCIADRF